MPWNSKRLVIRSHIEEVKKFCQVRGIRFKVWRLWEKNKIKTKRQLKKELEAKKKEEEDVFI